jgi:hypothetical protein
MQDNKIRVCIMGMPKMLTADIIKAVESSAVMHVVEKHGEALKPQYLDTYIHKGMPSLPLKQTYVPKLNRKSKRW